VKYSCALFQLLLVSFVLVVLWMMVLEVLKEWNCSHL
jgi:hypothetical protein